MKKAIFIIAVLLAPVLSYSQDGAGAVTVNFKMDTGLLFLGDDKGNDPGTVNYSFRSEWRGLQREGYLFGLNVGGYLFVAPEFEYADLAGGIYRRYSANAGYSFNSLFGTDSGIVLSSSLGYGIIQYNGGWRGFGANFQVAYTLVKGVELYLDAELVDRQDQRIYGPKYEKLENRIKFSGKAGIKITLHRVNKR